MEAGVALKRRDFLAASALGLIGCTRKSAAPLPPGALLGPSHRLGHRLHDGQSFATPSETRKIDTLIIGGGMAGLACGWWLARHGHHDFALLELESETGGNARGGRNAISAYPWGAHYLPLPGPEAVEIRQMLSDFGALLGDPTVLKPTYDERFLCFAPQERLHINGVWQDGLLPQFGIAANERKQQQAFIQRMAAFKAEHDEAGRTRFAVPHRRGLAVDPALDTITMHDWLHREGFDAPSLHWWVNYACRDDFGTDYRAVSAWAGIHYYASRHGLGANADSDDVLTWPEGNGWLTHRLAQAIQPNIQTGSMAFNIQPGVSTTQVDIALSGENRSVRYLANRVVWAAPVGFLPHVWHDLPAAWRNAAAQISYAPWLVANLSLSEAPDAGHGSPLSWDNVLYQGAGLGYVVANHQAMAVNQREKVLTYYRPLSELPPPIARQQLLSNSREYWAAAILGDLRRAHPDIDRLTTQLDVYRWGHAMARPLPGLSDGHLATLRQPNGRIMLAHADLSGFSIAEEAHYWGVRAARWALNQDWDTA